MVKFKSSHQTHGYLDLAVEHFVDHSLNLGPIHEINPGDWVRRRSKSWPL
jgi:hypothetical protein